MSKVKIIAEAGVNHNGDMELAKKLIEAAADAGADYVKFQTFNSKKLVSKFAGKADYQLETTDKSESQLKMLQKLELSKEDHDLLISHCENKNIKFLSSPFDLESIEYLKSIDIALFKIPSGEITNLPYLRKIAKYNIETILSTGMSSMSDVKEAVELLIKEGLDKNKLTVLHCNTEYPTPFKDVNLRAMLTIKEELGVNIGYSDHTLGIEIPIAAVAMGAQVIEKHFTLDKTMEGPDHRASLEPSELKHMVSAIRNIEESLGSSVKEPSESESKNIPIARKSIVASRLIKKDEVFSEDNITVKRPGSGISPMKYDEVIGKIAKRNFEEDELVEL